MNVKNLALIGVIALVVVGFVLAAGCTASQDDPATRSVTTTSTTIKTVDENGTVISSSASGSFTITIEDYGTLTVSVTDKDPVIGAWVCDEAKMAYVLKGDGTGTLYDVGSDGSLQYPDERIWGKIDGRENQYLVSAQKSGRCVLLTYSPEEQTLTNPGNQVFKRTTLSS